MRRTIHAALVALALLVGGEAGAQAHAVLLEVEPGDGVELEMAPAEFRLRFSEPVSPVALRLLDAQGAEIGTVVETHGDTIALRPIAALPQGAYFLSYRVTSLDAHLVGATLRFGIGVPPPGAAAQDEREPWSAWAAVAARWLFYVTALGSIGLGLFAVVVQPPVPVAARSRALSARLATLGLIAAAARLGIAGLELGDLPASALAGSRPWALAAGTSLGTASALAAAGLAVMVFARKLPAWALAVGAVTVAVSFALTGHAASADPRLLTAAALPLHVLCVAFWLGSFLPLWWSLALEPPLASKVVRRFSRAAMLAVALLLAAGATLAWIQLGGDLAALATTGYGWLLSSKLALVAGLLALAALNRLVLTPDLADGRPNGAIRLRQSLAIDIALGLGVLAVTAAFPLTTPPRALIEAAAERGLTVVASGASGQATLTLIPGGVGLNRLEAGIADREGAPIAAREATFSWSMPAAGIEPIRIAASQALPGVVTATGIALPRPGRWRLRLDLLIDDFTKLTYEGEIDVR